MKHFIDCREKEIIGSTRRASFWGCPRDLLLVRGFIKTPRSPSLLRNCTFAAWLKAVRRIMGNAISPGDVERGHIEKVRSSLLENTGAPRRRYDPRPETRWALGLHEKIGHQKARFPQCSRQSVGSVSRSRGESFGDPCSPLVLVPRDEHSAHGPSTGASQLAARMRDNCVRGHIMSP